MSDAQLRLLDDDPPAPSTPTNGEAEKVYTVGSEGATVEIQSLHQKADNQL